MKVVRTLENVTGPTLTIAVPSDFAGMQVEVIILPVQKSEEPVPPEQDSRYAHYLMKKPDLSQEDKDLFAKTAYPLRGMSSEYVEPFESIVPVSDWEAVGDDPA